MADAGNFILVTFGFVRESVGCQVPYSRNLFVSGGLPSTQHSETSPI